LTSFEGNYNLWETDLRTRDTKQLIRLNTGGGSLVWDKNMENLYLLSRGSISKLNLSGGSSSGIRIAGEMTYDAHKERVEAFEHVYIRTKNSTSLHFMVLTGISWLKNIASSCHTSEIHMNSLKCSQSSLAS